MGFSMRNMLQINALVLLLVMSNHVMAAEPNQFEKLKSDFQKQIQKISDDEVIELIKLQDSYQKNLEAVEKNLKSKGNLDAVLEVQKEKERFLKEKELKQENISQTLPEIAAIQNKYISSKANIPYGPAKKITSQAAAYEKALSNLQAELTKKNEIDLAVAVKKEKQDIENIQEVVRARGIVAAQQEELKKQNEAKQQADKEKAEAENEDAEKEKAVQEEKNDKPKKVTGNPELIIKKKYKEFIGRIMDYEWEKAIEYIDPGFVSDTGKDNAREMLKTRFIHMANFASGRKIKLQASDVELSEDKKTAKAKEKAWLNNRWVDVGAHSWIEVDGDWYMDCKSSFDSGPAMLPGMDDHKGKGK